ncbi:DNA primase [Mucinivorans hirudinis]|uniref:DNA primase n=1 Tax=Mucinivorans hirudinis TaxID=1433126 RepID=A0A060R8B0_9BACT|nr:DNA primase [Mucinivorans hirudinis]
MIDRSTIDRIFSAADIVEVVSDYVTLKRKGVNYTACCPFHNEKTPSFMVSPAKGLYKCFGCGKGGNSVSFVMEHEKLSYPEALRLLAKKYNITIEERQLSEEEVVSNNDRESMMVLNSWASDFFVQELPKADFAYQYFVERGFTEQTIKKFGLGYCPENGEMAVAALKAGFQEQFLERTGLAGKRERGGFYDRFFGRVMFPIHSLSGRVIGFGGRTLRADKKVAKYLNSPESEVYHKSFTLYGIFFAKKAITQSDRCILVEGYTDVIQMHQAGIENVVASSGTSLTEEQIRLIKRFTNNITVIYDGDSAGIKASMRGIDMILQAGLTVRCVMLPEGEDPDSFAKSNSTQYLADYIAQNEVDFIRFKTALLLKDAEDDPIRRAEVISDIVSTIALIPSAIEQQVFIRECSRLLDISQDLLQVEVRRKSLGLVSGQKWYEKVRPRESEPVFAEDRDAVLQQIEVLEGEVIKYLVKYGGENFMFEDENFTEVEMPIAETILGELDSLEIVFANPLYVKILQMCESGIIKRDEMINSPEADVATFVTDLEFSEQLYNESRYWERSEKVFSTEKQRLGVAIPKSLSLLFERLAEQKIKLLIGTIQGENDTDIMLEINRLNELRKQIRERWDRIV